MGGATLQRNVRSRAAPRVTSFADARAVDDDLTGVDEQGFPSRDLGLAFDESAAGARLRGRR